MMTTSPQPPTLTARPLLWLGAQSSGGLTLPDASPTPSQMYAPRGVYLDDRALVIADSGNHRVLIWHQFPATDGQPADLVLGQPDFWTEGPAAGGRGPQQGMHLPTGVLIADGQLLVADAWHHRVLVWRRVPESSATPPDYAIGQADLAQVEPNRGGEADLSGLYWPYGIAWINQRLYVADTGNRRVLAWDGIPQPNQPADLLLGQATPQQREENRGASPQADSFRWPHGIAGDSETLYIADAGNHRVLGWTPPPSADAPANLLMGQSAFTQAVETPHVAQGAARLRFPYDVSYEAGLLAVADTANNRVLLWDDAPRNGLAIPAQAVLGQVDFDKSGENRWTAVLHDTLCWPYGLHLHQRRLVIADSGNNRVMIWGISSSADEA